MLRITSKNKIYFVGKSYEVIEAIENLSLKYSPNTTILEIIDDLLKD
ncbi:hypothetical protein CLPU_17c00440 [Gottschalkia purinilytica]|uniref:Uncharacterized protein n=1 Tax=Gottschalkia purinilytica TaxID=1503 RepID=A0A0L0W7D2_GOTPU|nr:hypothetical protein [Gottschalkia purinilytica]KNF07419.1 hypothetical protein CLPU_17c00440 [Gottschalkia purinilytica]